jgi:hypothetical protein
VSINTQCTINNGWFINWCKFMQIYVIKYWIWCLSIIIKMMIFSFRALSIIQNNWQALLFFSIIFWVFYDFVCFYFSNHFKKILKGNIKRKDVNYLNYHTNPFDLTNDFLMWFVHHQYVLPDYHSKVFWWAKMIFQFKNFDF